MLAVIEIRVDVGVVELDARRWWWSAVVQELRSLIEEGCVVLIALDEQ